MVQDQLFEHDRPHLLHIHVVPSLAKAPTQVRAHQMHQLAQEVRVHDLFASLSIHDRHVYVVFVGLRLVDAAQGLVVVLGGVSARGLAGLAVGGENCLDRSLPPQPFVLLLVLAGQEIEAGLIHFEGDLDLQDILSQRLPLLRIAFG